MGEYGEQDIREPHCDGGTVCGQWASHSVGDGIWSCYIKFGKPAAAIIQWGRHRQDKWGGYALLTQKKTMQEKTARGKTAR